MVHHPCTRQASDLNSHFSLAFMLSKFFPFLNHRVALRNGPCPHKQLHPSRYGSQLEHQQQPQHAHLQQQPRQWQEQQVSCVSAPVLSPSMCSLRSSLKVECDISPSITVLASSICSRGAVRIVVSLSEATESVSD